MTLKPLDKLPEGWKWVKGATNTPKGFKWAYNGESFFSGKRLQALVKVSQGGKGND